MSYMTVHTSVPYNDLYHESLSHGVDSKLIHTRIELMFIFILIPPIYIHEI